VGSPSVGEQGAAWQDGSYVENKFLPSVIFRRQHTLILL